MGVVVHPRGRACLRLRAAGLPVRQAGDERTGGSGGGKRDEGRDPRGRKHAAEPAGERRRAWGWLCAHGLVAGHGGAAPQSLRVSAAAFAELGRHCPGVAVWTEPVEASERRGPRSSPFLIPRPEETASGDRAGGGAVSFGSTEAP
uniref:Uncharacterized protein n=1 Tax=Rangifer tarandus platyrhynchus TaxID=3082113 RepID=A0ACB0DPL6_RANTA|nr:unnamed protein product [Rangifer tarandus platyrhynchus]